MIFKAFSHRVHDIVEVIGTRTRKEFFDLGYFDGDSIRFEPLDKSFWSKSVTYLSGIICNLCVRNGPVVFGRGRGI